MKQQVNTQSSEGLFDVRKVDVMHHDVKSIGDLRKPGGVIQEMIKSALERIKSQAGASPRLYDQRECRRTAVQ